MGLWWSRLWLQRLLRYYFYIFIIYCRLHFVKCMKFYLGADYYGYGGYGGGYNQGGYGYDYPGNYGGSYGKYPNYPYNNNKNQNRKQQ